MEAALGGPVQEEVQRWVLDRSQGNPLYARELVLGAVDSGRLVAERGLWRLAGLPSVAASLVELVGGRMGELTGEQRAPDRAARARGAVARVRDRAPDLLRRARRRGVTRPDHPRHEAPRTSGSRTRSTATSCAPACPGCAHARCGGASRARCWNATRWHRTTRCAIVRLLLDAGAPIPPPLLIDAARAANLAGDPDARRPARRAGGGRRRRRRRRARARPRERDPRALPGGRGGTGRDRVRAARSPVRGRLPRAARARALLGPRRHRGDARAARPRARPGATASAGGDSCSRCACRPPWRRTSPARSPRPRRRSRDPELDEETGRLLETRLAMALFYSGRWTESRALARRHCPAIPIRDYTGLMTLPAYRFAAVESGADWPGLAADLARILADGVRCHDHEAAAQAAVGIGLPRVPRRALQRRRALAVGGGAALRARGRLRPRRRRAPAADRDRRPHRRHRRHRPRARTAASDRRRGPSAAALAQGLSRPRRGLGDVRAQPATGRRRAAGRRRDLPRRHAGLHRAAGLRRPARGRRRRPGRARCWPRSRHAARRGSSTPTPPTRTRSRAATAHALLAVADEFAAIGARHYAMHAAAHAATRFVADGRQDSARRAAARAADLHEPGQGSRAARRSTGSTRWPWR